jgi:hypothetical protein
MSEHPRSRPLPAPGPECAAFAPLLPLLTTHVLRPDQELALYGHLDTCPWCRSELAGYDAMEAGLRQRYASLPSDRPLTMEQVVRASRGVAQPPHASHPITGPQRMPLWERAPSISGWPRSPFAAFGSRGGAAGANYVRRRTTPLAALGAIAATLLLVGLAAALFANMRSRPTTGAPVGTSGPVASCATALPGAAPAASISGFLSVTFPANAAITQIASSQGGAGQFTIEETDVCYGGTTANLTGSAATRHSVVASLLGVGWRTSAVFPYRGAVLESCPSQCYEISNTHYLALERITDHGDGIVTYHLRLAAPPPAPTCNADFANSPTKGVQTSVEGVPLPPLTRVAPDNAANLHGYDLCSAGTATSVAAFLTSAMPASGWTQVASDPRCFFADECWTKGGAAVSWQVGDPTDWHIAYHPMTA